MAKKYELRLGSNTDNPLDGGVRFDDETILNNSQSPHNGLLNLCLDNGRILGKRQGQTYLLEDDISVHPVYGMYSDYKGSLIVHIGDKLYDFKSDIDYKAITCPALALNKSKLFAFNSKLYILDGEKYLQYDGKECKEVEPYVPRVNMNRKPDGSNSMIDESWNLLGNAFKNTFNGDGESTLYKLSLDGLDDTSPIVKINGKVVASDEYTFDRFEGEIKFSKVPVKGDNNIEITAYKTFPELRDNILKCSIAEEFSNRIFISGNPNIKNTYYAGGITENFDASYFPQKYTYVISGDDKAITGFKALQNKLVVFKENMTCIIEEATGLDNTASFPISFLNVEIGCDIPDSIQLLNDAVVFANTYGGVFVIVSTYQGEKNIKNISRNINGTNQRHGLLQEANLKNATSMDHDFKYYLATPSGNCYVFDYLDGINTENSSSKSRSACYNKWFLFNNIHANKFGTMNNKLIYGSSEKGNIVLFTDSKSDFGEPIEAYWKSKLLDFGYPDWLKMVSTMWVTFASSVSGNNAKINYYNEKGVKESEVIIEPKDGFSWSNFCWDKFTWGINLFDSTKKKKVRAKKITYFQIEIYNNKLNEDLSIKNIVLEYRLMRKVR